MNVVPPVVVDGDGDLVVYSTVATACQAVEPDDVDLFQVFDSAGRQYILVPDGMTVRMEELPNSLPDPAELESRLRRHIESLGSTQLKLKRLDDVSLPAMLGALLTFQNKVTPSRIPFWRRSTPRGN